MSTPIPASEGGFRCTRQGGIWIDLGGPEDDSKFPEISEDDSQFPVIYVFGGETVFRGNGGGGHCLAVRFLKSDRSYGTRYMKRRTLNIFSGHS